MKIKEKPRKKRWKTKDPTWETQTYGSGKTPFEIEWLKYYNPVEGRDQILFLYKDKKTKGICKYRILR
tara:strand:+ start:856 stop:1059 length:204 start_codon:yes stop_codon:yes gene_type:complete